MDPKSRLDSALIQLTPTRTRFDLVLFRGNKNEKIASGLFDPFISHLKFARDQISRGGYSISLHPPKNEASWFTKATFERFVRFVDTPAILERFVSIEKEILQIEHSIQANESSNTSGAVQPEEGSNSAENGMLRKSSDSSKLRRESEKNDDDAQEENSKIQLQRLLETRRTLLRREQAMAYARGVVAGFDIDSSEDLISFADAFGASRLREACNSYKELWKKKHGDGLWMAELAAVESCSSSDIPLLGSSGIVLTNDVNLLAFNGSDSSTINGSSDFKKDDNLPASDQIASAATKFQAAMPWSNQIPPYFYNFGGPIQQFPPYQGYPFPPMQPVPHQYPGNMQWPKKGKSSNKKGSESSESSESDTESENSASSSEDQERTHSKNVKDHHRSRTKHRKKPSKTVIIRNINYITPEGRQEDMEDGDELIDKVSLKEKVDAAVGLLGKKKRVAANQDSDSDLVESASDVRKSNENWDAFQNFLMKDEKKSVEEATKLPSMDVGEERFTVRSSAVDLTSENVLKKGKVSADSFIVSERSRENEVDAKFEDFENGESNHKLMRRKDSTEENMLLPPRSTSLGNESKDVLYPAGGDRSVIKSGRGEDWFVANHDTENQHTTFDGDCILPSEGFCKPQVEKSRKETFIDDSFMVQPLNVAADDLYDSRWRQDINIVADLSLAYDMENGHANKEQDKHEAIDPCEPNDLCMVLERNSVAVEDSWAMDYGIDFSVVESDNGRWSSIQSNLEDEKRTSTGDKTSAVRNSKKDVGKDVRSRISSVKNRTEIISKSGKKPSLASRTLVQKSKHEKEEEMRKRMEDLMIQRQNRIAERTAAASRRVSIESKTCDKNKTTSTANRVSSVRVKAT